MDKKLKGIAQALVMYILNTNTKNVGDFNELIQEIFNSHIQITYKTSSQYKEFNEYINNLVTKYNK
mgnify:CR=1 FL=1